MREFLARSRRLAGQAALIILMVFGSPLVAFAAGGSSTPPASGSGTGTNGGVPTTTTPIDISTFFSNTTNFVHQIATFVWGLLTVVFVISIVINSIRLMLGAHDPQKRLQAMQGYGWTSLAGVAAFGVGYWASLAYGVANQIGGH